MVSGITNVSSDDDAYTVYQIYSVDGKLLKNGSDVSSMPKGVYILKAKNGRKVKSFKVVNK